MQTPSSYCFCLEISNFSYTERVIIAQENIDINTVTHLIVSYIIFIYKKRQLKDIIQHVVLQAPAQRIDGTVSSKNGSKKERKNGV